MKQPSADEKFICRYCGDEFEYMMDRDYHLKTHPVHYENMYIAMMKDKDIALQEQQKQHQKELTDQKTKIREWAKKTFTPENMEDKFGITVTKYECKNLLKEFEEAKL